MATKTSPVSNRKSPAKPKVAKAPISNQTLPAPVGRPLKYKPEYAEKAYKFCLLGMNNTQLAEAFDVHLDTIYTWIKTFPEFGEKLSEGRECADAEIAKSLYHRAKGYSHPDEDIRVVANNIVVTPTIKHYPPDTAAASLWLRNRQSDKWRDKTEVDHSGSLTIDKMPDDVLKERMAELFARMQAK